MTFWFYFRKTKYIGNLMHAWIHPMVLLAKVHSLIGRFPFLYLRFTDGSNAPEHHWLDDSSNKINSQGAGMISPYRLYSWGCSGILASYFQRIWEIKTINHYTRWTQHLINQLLPLTNWTAICLEENRGNFHTQWFSLQWRGQPVIDMADWQLVPFNRD